MMLGRDASARDRGILTQKLAARAAKGPRGWWRIVKNLVRFGLHIGSARPASPRFWTDALRAAGFNDVHYRALVAEPVVIAGLP